MNFSKSAVPNFVTVFTTDQTNKYTCLIKVKQLFIMVVKLKKLEQLLMFFL